MKSPETFSTLLAKDKIYFLRSKTFLVSVKMKKHKCVIENINAKKIRYAFYGRQNFGT